MCGSIVNVKISVIALITIGVVVRDLDAKRFRRIIGGEDAGADEFPWMARLDITHEKGANYDCGGAIIGSRHILTTANCLSNATVNSIWTGCNVRDCNVTVKSSSAKIIVHPEYKCYSKDGLRYIENNVGIVVLDKKLQLNKDQKVISLTKNKTAVGTRALLSGWGFTDELVEHRAMVLKKIPITILPADKCPAMVANQLCGGSIPKAKPYYGDLGSPLVVDGRIVGLLSNMLRLPGQEAIYTDVYYYREWIKSLQSKKKFKILQNLRTPTRLT